MSSIRISRPAQIKSRMVLLVMAACLEHGNSRIRSAGSMQNPVPAKPAMRYVPQAVPSRRCGNVAPTPGNRLLLEGRQRQASAVASAAANITLAATARPTVGLASNSSQREYIIHTYVHNVLVADSTGAFFGAVTPQQVRLQLAALNAAYNTSAQQAGITWLYKLANITNTSIALAGDMCNEQTSMQLKQRLRQGSATALNLYVTDMSQCGVLGVASWPWEITGGSSSIGDTNSITISNTRVFEGSSSAATDNNSSPNGSSNNSSPAVSSNSSSIKIIKGLVLDGVTVHYDTLPLGELEGYNTGGTAIHEVGHWHGLLHVFENGCSPPGDGVDDTAYCLPPDDGSCPGSRDSCPQQPGQDPISNWMSYSVDSCMSSFSPGQLRRAERMWQQHRLPAG